MLLSAVEKSLAEQAIERRGEVRVLVACSGGVDSVVLAEACSELLGGRRVILGHVDHGVRAGSAADRRFVEALAGRLHVEIRADRVDAPRDDEATLRALRYERLEAQRQDVGAELILTAHNRDDQAETVLLGLIRTARLEALGGIPPRRGRILRPMLTVPRSEVLRFARDRGLSWREDPSNRAPRYLRNRLRKELLPLIESRYRPGFSARLASLAESVQSLGAVGGDPEDS